MSKNLKSRIKRKKSELKNAAKNLFKYDINRVKGLEMLENFLVKTYFLKSESFADYCSGNIKTRRRIIAHILNSILLVLFLEYSLIAVMNEPYIRTLLSDPFYLLGESRTIPLIFTFACLSLWLQGIHF